MKNWHYCLIRLYGILELQFKLIWDIEKDWGINPIDLHPELRQHLLNKGHHYPIYEDAWDMLLGDHYGLLKIKPETYKSLLTLENMKKFDQVLESKIISYYLNNYIDYSFICKFFSRYSKCIIEDFQFINSNQLIQQVAKDLNVQLQLKNTKYYMVSDEFLDIYGIHSQIIINVGMDIAKWREEWELDNKNNEIKI